MQAYDALRTCWRTLHFVRASVHAFAVRCAPYAGAVRALEAYALRAWKKVSEITRSDGFAKKAVEVRTTKFCSVDQKEPTGTGGKGPEPLETIGQWS